MLTNFLKNWIADVIIDVSKSLGLTKDNVSMSANDKVFEATITFDNGTEYVYYISAVENIRDGQIIFIDRIDGKGATKECRTKEQVYDFLKNDINTGLVAEATEILESQGYKVVLNEAFVEDDSANIDIDSADDIFALGNDILKKAGFMNEDGYQLIDEAISEGRYCIMNKNDNTYFTGIGATDKCFPWTDDIEKAYRRFGNESYAKYSAMETIDYIVWHDGKRLGIDTSDLVVVDTKTGETFEYTEEKPKGFFRFD